MNLLLKYFNLSKTQLFVGIVLINLVIIWLSKSILINEIVFYNTYSEQLTYDRSIKLFQKLKEIAWISYVFYPILLIGKFTLVSSVLYIGIFFCNLQYKITFGSVFKIVIASELIFIIAGLIKFLWFCFFAGNYDLNDMSFFYPLSLINLFKISEVDKIWIYPLQIVNIFQAIYFIALSYGLNKVCMIDKHDSDKIVLTSYLPALVLWIALIMFISIDTLL
jgi:hypothetical protein